MSTRLPLVAASTLVAMLLVPLPAAAQLPSATSDVVVIDAGAEPRQELRYAWEEDQRERGVFLHDVLLSLRLPRPVREGRLRAKEGRDPEAPASVRVPGRRRGSAGWGTLHFRGQSPSLR